MEAYYSESSPPIPIPKLPMTPAPPVCHHRAATGLGGLPQLCVGGKANLTLASHAAGDMAELKDLTAKPVWDVLMMQGGTAGSRSNPLSADHDANNEAFIVDSGASVHATGDRALFSDDITAALQPEDTLVLRMANGSTLTVQGCGTVRHDNITLHGVLYAPGLDINAVSVSKLGEQGYTVEFTRTTCFIRDASTGDLAGKGHLVDGLYELDFLEALRA